MKNVEGNYFLLGESYLNWQRFEWRAGRLNYITDNFIYKQLKPQMMISLESTQNFIKTNEKRNVFAKRFNAERSRWTSQRNLHKLGWCMRRFSRSLSDRLAGVKLEFLSSPFLFSSIFLNAPTEFWVRRGKRKIWMPLQNRVSGASRTHISKTKILTHSSFSFQHSVCEDWSE